MVLFDSITTVLSSSLQLTDTIQHGDARRVEDLFLRRHQRPAPSSWLQSDNVQWIVSQQDFNHWILAARRAGNHPPTTAYHHVSLELRRRNRNTPFLRTNQMQYLSLWCRVLLRPRRGSWNGVVKMVRQVGDDVGFAL